MCNFYCNAFSVSMTGLAVFHDFEVESETFVFFPNMEKTESKTKERANCNFCGRGKSAQICGALYFNENCTAHKRCMVNFSTVCCR